MLKKYINNKTFIFIQLIIITLSMKYTINNICHNFELNPGISFVTKDTKSSWQIIKSKTYNNSTLPDFSKIKYHNIYSYLKDEYPSFKGHITLWDENEEDIIGVFNKFLFQLNYYDFIYNFNKYVDMNKEIYLLDIKDGLLYLMFLNNCSNSSVIYEKDNICKIKDMYYNNINMFIEEFFNERLELPDYCYNNKLFYKILYILSSFILLLIILNIFTYIFLFLLCYLKNINITYNNEYIPLK